MSAKQSTMRKSPKKCLFPSNQSKSKEISHISTQMQLSRHSPHGKSHSAQSNNTKRCENVPSDYTPVLSDGQSCQSLTEASLGSQSQAQTVNYQNIQSASSAVNNENNVPAKKCSYKIFGVKKNLLLRSGVASFPMGNELKTSPKRIPLSPLKSDTRLQTSLELSKELNKRHESSITMPLKLKFTDKENPESGSMRNLSSVYDDCPTDLSKSSMETARLDHEKPRSPVATAPQYSPISSASESSNVSDVTDSSTTPTSSNSTDDVTHYSIRAPSSGGPSTKLTLVRQAGPCPDKAPIFKISKFRNPISNMEETNYPKDHEAPMDMTLKRSQVSDRLLGSDVVEKTSRKRSQDIITTLGEMQGKSLRTDNLPPKQGLIPSSVTNNCYKGKENIPPPLSSHLRTSTPEPLVSQVLLRKRKKTLNVDTQLSRPSTAPPAVYSDLTSPEAIDLSSGSNQARRCDGSEGKDEGAASESETSDSRTSLSKIQDADTDAEEKVFENDLQKTEGGE